MNRDVDNSNSIVSTENIQNSFELETSKIHIPAAEDIKEQSSCLKKIEALDEAEQKVRVKSADVKERLRKTLPLIEASKSSDKEPIRNSVPITPLFQTDIPDEDLIRARERFNKRKKDLFGDLNLEALNLTTIVNTAVIDHYEKGIKLADESKYEEAILHFTKAINLRRSETQCYVERAECFLQLCDFSSAYLNYHKAHLLEPNDTLIKDKVAFVAYMHGQCLFDQRLFTDALKKFSIACSMKPDNWSYNIRTISCMAALGRYEDCLTLVTGCIDQDPKNADLYVLRARLHIKFKNCSTAYYDVKEALRIKPQLKPAFTIMKSLCDEAEQYRKKAVALALEMRLGDAILKISNAIECNPTCAAYNVCRGSLHRRVNNFNEAVDDLLLALDKCDSCECEDYKQAQKQLLITYNDFAVYCYDRSLFDEAVILLNKAIDDEKSEVGLYINRGDCFLKLNNLDFALADYQQALEMKSSEDIKNRISVVYNEMGIMSYYEKLYDDATVKFSMAIHHNNKLSQLYIHRATCFYVIQAYKNCRDDVITAMLIDPINVELGPFLSRLFPGKSMEEILNSQLVANTRFRLSSILEDSTIKLKPINKSERSPKSEYKSTKDASNNKFPIKRLRSNIKLVEQKKQVKLKYNEIFKQGQLLQDERLQISNKLSAHKNSSTVKQPLKQKRTHEWKNHFI